MASGHGGKARNFSGKTYVPAVGTTSDQTVKATGGFIGSVAAVGTGNLTIKDGTTVVWLMTAPAALFLGIETQTSVIVNAPATCTVSMGYD